MSWAIGKSCFNPLPCPAAIRRIRQPCTAAAATAALTVEIAATDWPHQKLVVGCVDDEGWINLRLITTVVAFPSHHPAINIFSGISEIQTCKRTSTFPQRHNFKKSLLVYPVCHLRLRHRPRVRRLLTGAADGQGAGA